MSHATKPATPRGIPQDANTGPRGKGTEGRTPGKGRQPTGYYGTDKRLYRKVHSFVSRLSMRAVMTM
jgi:hypothetical protein